MSVSADVVPEALATSGPVAVVGQASTMGASAPRTPRRARTESQRRADALAAMADAAATAHPESRRPEPL